MSKSYYQVSNRHIAKMLVSVIPVDFKADDFRSQVDLIAKKIDKMPTIQQAILKAAYVFSRKCPKVERQDLYQELTLKLLENSPQNEQWAYTIARTDWLDWYKGYKIKSQYSTVDIESLIATELGINAIALHRLETEYPDISPIVDTERAKEYSKRSYHVALESLTGMLEYELIDNREAAKTLLASIPSEIKRIAKKRLASIALTANERQKLCRFIKRNPELVAQYNQS